LTKLNDDDDYLHKPDERPNFRESYYFNWVDEPSGVSGFSTIGLLPNAKKREFVFALFYEDKREAYWKEPDGVVPVDIDEALSNGMLSFELVNPMNDWKIVYHGEELSAEILWSGRFPYYDFGGGSGTSWVGHFEQSGIVKGTVTLQDGRKLSFHGLGQRDKSWGSRDWHIEAWYAFHAQFKDISIGLRRDQVKGKFIPSGGISTADGFVPITKVNVETKYIEEPIKMPFAAKTTVHGEDGSVYTCHSKTLTPTSFVRFEREFKGGRTELFENMAVHVCEELNERGSGLLEWLFTH
jgi:hypothetical protein